MLDLVEDAQQVVPGEQADVLVRLAAAEELGQQGGVVETSSSPTGTLVMPSKSPPRPTWSMPATLRMWSMWSATCASVARGDGGSSPPGVELALDALAASLGERACSRASLGGLPRRSTPRTSGETKARHEVDHHDAAVLRQQPQHVVGHVARVRRTARAPRSARRSPAPRDARSRRSSSSGETWREVDEHAEPVHLAHHLLAERREAAVLRARRWPRRPTACSSCG